MTTIWIYKFEDGTVLKLCENGLSVDELWKMQELHGKAQISTKKY